MEPSTKRWIGRRFSSLLQILFYPGMYQSIAVVWSPDSGRRNWRWNSICRLDYAGHQYSNHTGTVGRNHRWSFYLTLDDTQQHFYYHYQRSYSLSWSQAQRVSHSPSRQSGYLGSQDVVQGSKQAFSYKSGCGTKPSAIPKESEYLFTNTLGGKVKFQVDFTSVGGMQEQHVLHGLKMMRRIQPYNFVLASTAHSAGQKLYSQTQSNSRLSKQCLYMDSTKHTSQCDPRRCQHKSERQRNIRMVRSSLESALRHAGSSLESCRHGHHGLFFRSGRSTLCFPKWKHTWYNHESGQISFLRVFSSVSIGVRCIPPKFEMKGGTWVIAPANNQPVPDPNDKSLGNYYIDPRKANNSQDKDGGYHMRKVDLSSSTGFNMSPNQNSFGRFPYYPDSLILHPGGFAIGGISNTANLWSPHFKQEMA